jgi:hypothetical protein
LGAKNAAVVSAQYAFGCFGDGTPCLRGQCIPGSLGDIGKLTRHRHAPIAMKPDVLPDGFLDEAVVYEAFVATVFPR